MNTILDGAEAELIGGANDFPAANSAASRQVVKP